MFEVDRQPAPGTQAAQHFTSARRSRTFSVAFQKGSTVRMLTCAGIVTWSMTRCNSSAARIILGPGSEPSTKCLCTVACTAALRKRQSSPDADRANTAWICHATAPNEALHHISVSNPVLSPWHGACHHQRACQRLTTHPPSKEAPRNISARCITFELSLECP